MTTGDRLKVLLEDRHMTQYDFSKALGVSYNYINQVVNDKKGPISLSLAKLIEAKYGYSADWIMTGEGEPMSSESLSLLKEGLLKRVESMPDDEVAALLAFANSMDKVKKAFGVKSR